MRRQSFSWMRSIPSEVKEWKEEKVIPRFSEPCLRFLTSWMDSNQLRASKSLWQQIELIFWMMPCCDQVESIERLSSRTPTRMRESTSWKFTQERWISWEASISTRSPNKCQEHLALKVKQYALKPVCLPWEKEEFT